MPSPNQRRMDWRSYVCPEERVTGSRMRSQVMGHRNVSGMLPFELLLLLLLLAGHSGASGMLLCELLLLLLLLAGHGGVSGMLPIKI